MLSKVVDIDVDLCPRYENLQLVVVKCSQPVNVDHVVEAAAERLAVRTNLVHRHSELVELTVPVDT